MMIYAAILLCLFVASSLCSQEQCQTFAGGYVYPQELRPASGHQITWSKALSKFFTFFLICIEIKNSNSNSVNLMDLFICLLRFSLKQELTGLTMKNL